MCGLFYVKTMSRSFLVRLGLVCLILCAHYSILSQAINTDRPTQSASAYVLPQGRLQWEVGALFQKTSADLNQFVANNSLFRYGVSDNFEARLTFNYEGFKFNQDGGSLTERGFSPVVAGFKSKIADENGFWPQISFVGQVALPSGEEPFRVRTAVPGFRFSMQHNFASSSSIGYNWGMEWSEGIAGTTNIYTFLFSQGFADDFAWFLEFYGFITETEDDHRGNSGLTYLANEKLQLDASVGFGLSEISPDYFLSIGVSFAFIK